LWLIVLDGLLKSAVTKLEAFSYDVALKTPPRGIFPHLNSSHPPLLGAAYW